MNEASTRSTKDQINGHSTGRLMNAIDSSHPRNNRQIFISFMKSEVNKKHHQPKKEKERERTQKQEKKQAKVNGCFT